MAKPVLYVKQIEMLRDIPELVPAMKVDEEQWAIKIFSREVFHCQAYMPPNRRSFYKILFINKGEVIFTIGAQTYYINQPTVLFLHPNEICSWKNLSLLNGGESTGHYILFKEQYLQDNQIIKLLTDRYHCFLSAANNVKQLTPPVVQTIDNLFLKMQEALSKNTAAGHDNFLAYLQLMIVEGAQSSGPPLEQQILTKDFRHIQRFFQLLEKEFSGVNHEMPLRIKSAQDFANELALHPNYLNALLKAHTGQSLSSYLTSRIVEESKVLLRQTDWPLQQIGYALGFNDQSNFSRFFKKTTGQTAKQYRAAGITYSPAEQRGLN